MTLDDKINELAKVLEKVVQLSQKGYEQQQDQIESLQRRVEELEK